MYAAMAARMAPESWSTVAMTFPDAPRPPGHPLLPHPLITANYRYLAFELIGHAHHRYFRDVGKCA